MCLSGCKRLWKAGRCHSGNIPFCIYLYSINYTTYSVKSKPICCFCIVKSASIFPIPASLPRFLPRSTFYDNILPFFLSEALPVFSYFSEKKHVFFLQFRQSYVQGKKCAFFGKCLFPRKQKERIIMKSNNQINVPQAKAAMEQFKMQAAQEEDVFSTS